MFPQPIPHNFWGNYSIETLLGYWVPREIAEIVEENINKSVDFYLQLMKEKYPVEAIDDYASSLKTIIEGLMDKGIIKFSDDNHNAIDSWAVKKKINIEKHRFTENRNM